MIVQLNGKIEHKTSTEVVIECAGVGYSAMISVNTSEKLPTVGENAKLLTLLIPREDAMLLFGFADEAERNAFRLLTTVSGIGPKIALGILSSVTPGELARFIIGGNLSSLKKMPGVGTKTAERLILELKEKMVSLSSETGTKDDISFLIKQEALAALTTLGFSRMQAEKALNIAIENLSSKHYSAEELIKTALKYARQ